MEKAFQRQMLPTAAKQFATHEIRDQSLAAGPTEVISLYSKDVRKSA